VPRIDDVDFVSRLVFDPSRGPTTPTGPVCLPVPQRALGRHQVRLKPTLSDAARARAVAWCATR
jgi:hypothetical protein